MNNPTAEESAARLLEYCHQTEWECNNPENKSFNEMESCGDCLLCDTAADLTKLAEEMKNV